MEAAGWVMAVRWEIMAQVDDEAPVSMSFNLKSDYL
jgi:D-hexose-6-phosphate mutarotase